MMKDFGPKTWIYPMPVLIIGTYGPDGVPDAMNAAWGGISDDCRLSVTLALDRKTLENIKAKRCFTVFPATESTIEESDYFGMVHGHGIDKIAKAGFHHSRAPHVDAPLIHEYPMALECEAERIDIAEENDSAYITGRILNVCADSSILTAGMIDASKLRPAVFDPVSGSYLAVGTRVGKAHGAGCRFCD